MKKSISALVLFVAIFSSTVIVAKEKVSDLTKVVDKVSKLTGDKYILPKELKGSFSSTKNLQITKENSSKILSLLLHRNGYTRVKIDQGLYSIMEARDIRYETTEIFKGDKSTEMKVPYTHDYYMYEYSLENEGVSTDMTRAFRPFMSRYGRIIDLNTTNKIIIQDTGVNIHRLVNIIKTTDRSPNEEEKERREEQLKFKRKLKLIEAEHGAGCCCGKSE